MRQIPSCNIVVTQMGGDKNQAAACCLGNWIGSRMAIRVGPAAVRRFLTISLSLLLLTLVWQYFLAPSMH